MVSVFARIKSFVSSTLQLLVHGRLCNESGTVLLTANYQFCDFYIRSLEVRQVTDIYIPGVDDIRRIAQSFHLIFNFYEADAQDKLETLSVDVSFHDLRWSVGTQV